MKIRFRALFLPLLTAAVAAILILSLFFHYTSLRGETSQTGTLITESKARWNDVSDRKEELQKDLTALKETLRDAEISLRESIDHAAELSADIETLRSEIAALESELEKAQAAN